MTINGLELNVIVDGESEVRQKVPVMGPVIGLSFGIFRSYE